MAVKQPFARKPGLPNHVIASSDLESYCCQFGLVVNPRLIARGHVDHFHVPLSSGNQLEARDAFRISSGVERMQFPIYRLPAGNDKLIDKLAVECAEYGQSLSHLKRVRVTLRNDLHRIMQGRSVFFGSCAPDLKDCPDMFRIALANVLAKLIILRAFGKNVGNDFTFPFSKRFVGI